MEHSDKLIALNEDEMRVVGAVIKARGTGKDEVKAQYSISELIELWFTRENW